MLKKILVLIGLLVLIWPQPTAASSTAEYIDSMSSKITIKADSSLLIEEKINFYFPLPKHGIFRTLPESLNLGDKKQNMPISLISITDQNNKKIPYSQSYNRSDKTLTWKIGDPNKTIEGLQTYKISYKVENAIFFGNANFDEFYWNLNGNFWQQPIKKYTSEIIFPESITQENSETYIYAGKYKTKEEFVVEKSWNKNILSISSKNELQIGEGITLSIAMPKNIFTPPPPSFWEKYGTILQYGFFLIPILIIYLSYLVWTKFGRDPKVSKTIVPEFSIPADLSPLEMGILIQNGGFRNKYISAAIVNLAVKKIVKIEETSRKNYKLHLLKKDQSDLLPDEKLLVQKLFGQKEIVEINSLKDKFYTDIDEIKQNVIDSLAKKGLILKNNCWATTAYWTLAIIFGVLSFFLLNSNLYLLISVLLSFIALVIFAILMPRRTLTGARLMKKVEGFSLYMKTAERYRQEFNEKENIFEKFLPYAMVFGIVKEWTKSFAAIYEQTHHQNYFASYHPVWLAATTPNFDPDIFSQSISNLSSQMSATLASSPSSSGSGGGGFSGGGGGGGGGGSW